MSAEPKRRLPGTLNRQLMRAPVIDVLIETEDYDCASDEGRFIETDLAHAHIINSLLVNDAGEIANAFKAADDEPMPKGYRMHAPVLDIDFAAELVPSSTPGHYHLYLDKPMLEDDYLRLLTVLGEVGVLEPGYVAASLARDYSSARLPWVKKGDGTLHSDRAAAALTTQLEGMPF